MWQNEPGKLKLSNGVYKITERNNRFDTSSKNWEKLQTTYNSLKDFEKDKKACFDFAWNMTFGKLGQHRAYRSGGTKKRKDSEIFINTFQGKLAEFTLYRYLLSKNLKKIEKPDTKVMGLGSWDSYDLKYKGKTISVKSSKSKSQLLLLEYNDWTVKGNDAVYIPNYMNGTGESRNDYYVLVRFDTENLEKELEKNLKDKIEKTELEKLFAKCDWTYDLKCINNEELKNAIVSQKENKIEKDNYLFNEKSSNKMDADNYYFCASNMHPIDDLVEELRYANDNTNSNTQAAVSESNKKEYSDEEIKKYLKYFFGHKDFKSDMQKKSVVSALNGENLITVMPTASGKSVAYQLPALIRHKEWEDKIDALLENADISETEKKKKKEAWMSRSPLTIVISPLQALMTDQISNLSSSVDPEDSIDYPTMPEESFFIQKRKKGVAINSSLSCEDKIDTHSAIEDGSAAILYLSPESLLFRTTRFYIEKRTIDRFVIDEAHCFLEWGSNFRPDYRFIGDFIALLHHRGKNHIPVSCFTATITNKGIDEITEYFRKKISADSFTRCIANFERPNLSYHLHRVSGYAESENDFETAYNIHKRKLEMLWDLIRDKKISQVDNSGMYAVSKSAIIYTLYAKTALEITDYLREMIPHQSQENVRHFYGQMDKDEKKEVLNAFNEDEPCIIVATSAFGMGIDKSDVRSVIHFDIPESFECYIQEAGRAGRDGKPAECHILYSEKDFDKHDFLFKNAYLRGKEFESVWNYLRKHISKEDEIYIDPYDIKKETGLADTKIKASIQALSDDGIIKRDLNRFIDELDFNPDDLHYYNSRKKSVYIKYKKANCKSGNRFKPIFEEKLSDIVREFSDEHEKTEEHYYKLLKDKPTSTETAKFKDKLEERKKYKDYYEKLIYDYKRIQKTDNRLADYFYLVARRYDFRNFERWEIEKKYPDIYNTACSIMLNDYSIYHVDLQIEYYPDEIKKWYSFIENFFTNASKCLEEIRKIESVNSNEFTRCILKSITNIKLLYELDYIEYSFSPVQKSMRIVISTDKNVTTDRRINKIAKRIDAEADERRNMRRYLKGFIGILDPNQHPAQNKKERKKLADEYILDYYANTNGPVNFDERYNIIDEPIEDSVFNCNGVELPKEKLKVIKDISNKRILVTAGPGSGKTTLLAKKIRHLIEKEDILPQEILVLGFTNATTENIYHRVRKEMGPDMNGIIFSTIHSFAKRIGGEYDSDNHDKVFVSAINKINSAKVYGISKKLLDKKILILDEAQDLNEDQADFLNSLLCYFESIYPKETRLIAVMDDDQSIFDYNDTNNINTDHPYIIDTCAYDIDKLKDNPGFYQLTTNYRSVKEIIDYTEAFREEHYSNAGIKMSRNNKMNPGRKDSPCSNDSISKYILSEDDDCNEAIINTVCSDIKKVIKDKSTNCTTIAILRPENGSVNSIYNRIEKIYAGNPDVSVELIRKKTEKGNGTLYFPLSWLDEFHSLLRNLYKNDKKNSISYDRYKEALKKFRTGYENSTYKEPVCSFMRRYFHSYGSVEGIHYSHLLRTLNGIRFDDFYNEYVLNKCTESSSRVRICVSTVHRAKGKEFDRVYMCCPKNESLNTNEKESDLAKIRYVAMTRARNHLSVFDYDAIDNYTDNAKKTIANNTLNSAPLQNSMLPSIDDFYSLGDIFLSFHWRYATIKEDRIEDTEFNYGKAYDEYMKYPSSEFFRDTVKNLQAGNDLIMHNQYFVRLNEVNKDKGWIVGSSRHPYRNIRIGAVIVYPILPWFGGIGQYPLSKDDRSLLDTEIYKKFNTKEYISEPLTNEYIKKVTFSSFNDEKEKEDLDLKFINNNIPTDKKVLKKIILPIIILDKPDDE